MSGFRVPVKQARLVIEGEDFEGCEIVANMDVSLEALLWFEDIGSKISTREALIRFGNEFLLEWNLEHPKTGQALPADGEGLLQLPSWFAMQIFNQWLVLMRGGMVVPAPLGESSNNGPTSPEPSEQMAALSTGQQSSSTPSSS